MLRSVILAAAAASALGATGGFSPKEFKAVGRSNKQAKLRFSAALPMRNFDVLEKMLFERADPKSSNYGQWLSQDFVNTLTSPDPAVRAEVRAWLEQNGAECVDMPTSLRCVNTVGNIETALNTKITAFDHVANGNKRIHRIHPSESFSFPEQLQGKLLFMTNLADFPTMERRQGGIHGYVGNPAAGTDYIVTLESLWDLYGIPKPGQGPTSTQATVGPAEFQADQAVTKGDIKDFAAGNGVPAAWDITKIVGSYSGSDTEATLDEEYIATVSYGNPQWYWTENDWMYEWTETLKSAGAGNTPLLFSVSWGWSEQDQCTVDPSGPCSGGSSQAYVTATNQNFAAVTATGITIVVASGDSGAHGRTDPDCQSKKTRPDWPAACPYILSVGATQLSNGVSNGPFSTSYCQNPTEGACATGGTEIVASTATGALIVSGGGFSVYAAQPSWQAAAVKTYLASGALLPPAADFNSTNRGYPDVAAVGHNVLIHQQSSGGWIPVDGTSCAAPITGGVLALINAARINAGKSAIGFANTAIYQIAASTPAAFTDVTKGDNTCTENGCVAGCTGFGATKGWDATTGWGSPVYSQLEAAFLALP